MMRRLASALCDGARRVMPPARRGWATAMAAELVHIEADRAALAYAGGCLLAAARARLHDFETRFAAGRWTIALATLLFAALQSLCAARGVRALLGGRDGMLDALIRARGPHAPMVASYTQARPIVVACFLALSALHLAAAWFLTRAQLGRFLTVWCLAVLVAITAVAIQLSIVWTADGIPCEFHPLLVQAVALPALLAWSNGRHRIPEPQT